MHGKKENKKDVAYLYAPVYNISMKKKVRVSKKTTKKSHVTSRTREEPKGIKHKDKNTPSKRRTPQGYFSPSRVHSGIFSKVDKHIQNFDLKQAFLETFYMLGGVTELAHWAAWSNTNQTEFYRMLARMLPREMSLTAGNITPNDMSGMEDKELDAIIERHLTRRKTGHRKSSRS